MSSEIDPNNSNQVNVVLHDFQALLCKDVGERVEIVNYTTSFLLPKGENYGSTILKIETVIKKEKNSPNEKLHLVAKMIPMTEFQKSFLDPTVAFTKEIFILQKLFSVFRQVEEEAGVKLEHQIDVAPKYYGGRLSLRNGTTTKADENAVILMENLNTHGYYTGNRIRGLDLDHAKLAVTELARFHALGIAVRCKKPEFFEKAKKYLDQCPFNMQESDFDSVIESTIRTTCADSRIAKYEDRIKSSILSKSREDYLKLEAVEPWVTIIHGDFWVNNIMFRQAEKGKVNDVKFVDYQVSRVCSPTRDLPFFLCCSTNTNVLVDHFEELLDAYYENFIKMLVRTGCDASPFSRDSFDKQLKQDASEELFHCLMALKFVTLEASEDLDLNNMKSSILLGHGSDNFLERSWKVVSKFVEKEWI